MTIADEKLRPIFLKLPPENIAIFKFTVESYDYLGIVRTLNPESGEVVILTLEDTLRTAEELVDSIAEEMQLRRIPPPESVTTDWLLKEYYEPTTSP